LRKSRFCILATERQTDRRTGLLHKAALDVASGGLIMSVGPENDRSTLRTGKCRTQKCGTEIAGLDSLGMENSGANSILVGVSYGTLSHSRHCVER